MSQSTNEPPHGRSGTGELTESDRHRLLGDERRRMTLDVLEQRQSPVTLEELATGIAGREGGMDGVDQETVERVAISLHHAHLPLMDDLDVVDYDPSTRRVVP